MPRDGAGVASRTPTTAEIMNQHFVYIKVDREERPDLDDIYMTVCQLMTRRGGWPLTVLLTPEQRPFYVGTYFPPVERYGRPGFRQRAPRPLPEAWREQREDDREAGAESWHGAIAQTGEPLPPQGRCRTHRLVARRRATLAARFDRRTGASAAHPSSPTRWPWISCCARKAHRRRPLPATSSRSRCALHGRGRHLRPTGRGLPPLLGGRALARPALREDALRQRAAARGLPGEPGRPPASPCYRRSSRRPWTTSSGR